MVARPRGMGRRLFGIGPSVPGIPAVGNGKLDMNAKFFGTSHIRVCGDARKVCDGVLARSVGGLCPQQVICREKRTKLDLRAGLARRGGGACGVRPQSGGSAWRLRAGCGRKSGGPRWMFRLDGTGNLK